MYVKLISGYDLVQLQKCAAWLKSSSTVINRQGTAVMYKDSEEIAPEDVHNIQTKKKISHGD